MKQFLAALLVFTAALPALAHTGPHVSYQDLGGEPLLLPTARLHVLKEIQRSIRKTFAIGAQKIAVDFEIAKERLAEIKKLAEEKPEALQALARSEARYREHLRSLKIHFEAPGSRQNAGKLIQKFNDLASQHVLVFGEVSERVGERAAEDRKNEEILLDTARHAFSGKPEKEILHLLSQLESLYKEKIGVPPPDNSGAACIQLYDPVCGVNGITYSNSCFAGLSRVAVKYAGECTE